MCPLVPIDNRTWVKINAWGHCASHRSGYVSLQGQSTSLIVPLEIDVLRTVHSGLGPALTCRRTWAREDNVLEPLHWNLSSASLLYGFINPRVGDTQF